MSTTIAAQRQPMADHPLLIVERILRDRDGIWRQIQSEHRLNSLIGQMLASSAIALACYGAVLGLSNGPLQALASAIKLPILFLLTLAICLPTLYLFNLLFGARLSVRQALALVLVAITVTGALTLAFAPVSLFFLITDTSYAFFKLLNVSILTLTGAVGLGFLIEGMKRMNGLAYAERIKSIKAMALDEQSTDDKSEAEELTPVVERPVSMQLLYFWLVLYGFVGTQLGWTLRPFFGDPDKVFQFFRPIKGNFYEHMVRTVMELFR